MKRRFFYFLNGRVFRGNLTKQIGIGFILGLLLSLISKEYAQATGIFGTIFVTALKAVAPLLVFVVVTASIANHESEKKTAIRPILILYLLGTFMASVMAVLVSYFFPSTIILVTKNVLIEPPSGISEVLYGILIKLISNPIEALLNANYLGILVWAIGLGFGLRKSSESTKLILKDASNAVIFIVSWIIRFAPLGIFGLMAYTLSTTGFSSLWHYAHLLAALLGCLLIVALGLNPLLVWWKIRRNPYPLVWMCLRESGTTAFFTRSSAANIPVNMALAKKLKLDEATYSVSIPLGSIINMGGAAITITILTLAAVNTLYIPIDLPTAFLLSILASLCACGASGVSGGSLLLIPLACSMFGLPSDIAMQVVAVGFIISILQDAAETALNSSTDVLFTAAICESEKAKEERLKEKLQQCMKSE